MISKENIDPGLLEEMRKIGIIFANGVDGVERERKKLKESDLNAGSYLAADDIDFMLSKWKETRRYASSWADLCGARVLDIGSGSANTIIFGHRYMPHFARLCGLNGANVLAIDLEDQSPYDDMIFKSVRADLVPLVTEGKLHELPELNRRKFDLIHSRAFVGDNPDPRLERRIRIKPFEQQLIAECSRVLAEGGVMFLDAVDNHRNFIYYRMHNGDLVRGVGR